MAVDFKKPSCVSSTDAKRFGICDDQPPLPKGPAYLDHKDGKKWIAVVHNDSRFQVLFTAIDHCVDILRPDGTQEKRCDGMLTLHDSVIFVELKEIDMKGAGWIKQAEEQLRTTIGYFEKEPEAKAYEIKKAYIANSERPLFRESQQVRMERFEEETGYVLRIENRIIL